MNFIVRLFRPKQVEIVKRYSSTLTASEWRSVPSLTKDAREAIANPVILQMFDVLRNEHPGLGVLPDTAPDYVRLHWQSKAEGYSMALSVLKSLAIPLTTIQQLEATYEPEEIELQK